MPVVAVAGGSGNLGRAIVEAINSAGKFTVLILARVADEAKSKELGARIVAVDYNDPDAIASTLEQNGVEIVISALGSASPTEAELNLIKASDKSSVTKRYIPSIYGIRYTEEIASYFPIARGKLSYLQALEGTSLEWSAVLTGYFSDYWAPKSKSYMTPVTLVVDIPNKFAAIPGSGNTPVVLTHTFDVAKFTAALLTEEKWEKESYIIGDKLTLNEFVRIAEDVTGTKFRVEYDSVDKLKTGQITELPSHPPVYAFFPKPMLQGMFAALGLMFETGVFDLKSERTLNEVFPDIKPRTVKELLAESWAA